MKREVPFFLVFVKVLSEKGISGFQGWVGGVLEV